VRGVVATDAQIGVHASLTDPTLRANRCFLYHVVGNGTGEWRVPVGGLGAVADALVEAARAAGAHLRTNTPAASIGEHESGVDVSTVDGRTLTAGWVLAACAPAVVDAMLGRTPRATEGSQLKVNMVLRRLPRLRTGVDSGGSVGCTRHEPCWASRPSGSLQDSGPVNDLSRDLPAGDHPVTAQQYQ
jgi:phytoene dehydrogenase-like protein